VHADEKTGVAVDFYYALDSPLVEIDVLMRGQGHKAVGKKVTGSMRGWSSHSFQPLSLLGGGELEDSMGSGRAKLSLPHSRAK